MGSELNKEPFVGNKMKTRHAARVNGQTGVRPVKDENTPCGV